MRTTWRSTLPVVILLAALLMMALAPAAQAAPETAPAASCGYWYTVQPGDSWSRLSARTGISIAALQAANPAHIHPNNWLYVGHTLWIPCGGPPPTPVPPGCGYWYTVQPGDSWSNLSARTGVSVSALRAANPAHIHPNNWLYVGHTLWIPCGSPPPTPPTTCDYWYTVRPGDSWSNLSARTGVSVSALQAANPAHIHPNNWLYVGHTLWIPCVATPY